jgi:molybdopterin-guanine dinucleotide biosynthesis protein A
VNFVCVVLAGGEGRRMGGAKPLQPFEGAPLLARALALADGYADDVAVAVRDPAQLGGVSASWLLDDPAIAGPLGGLAAALAHGRSLGADAVLTLPCDAPRLPRDLAQRLVEALAAAPGAHAAVAASGGHWHPVCALWRASALDRLPAYLATGARSLRGFASACEAAAVEWSTQAHDPFVNANTPEDLAALQRGGASEERS